MGPQTLEERKQDPSKKLDVLVSILQWHLESDGRPPLKVLNNEVMPSVSTADIDISAITSLPPDKIVVYSAFVSCSTQLSRVSSH